MKNATLICMLAEIKVGRIEEAKAEQNNEVESNHNSGERYHGESSVNDQPQAPTEKAAGKIDFMIMVPNELLKDVEAKLPGVLLVKLMILDCATFRSG